MTDATAEVNGEVVLPAVVKRSYLIGREQAPLEVVARPVPDSIEILLRLPLTEPCLLHWGLARHAGGTWTRPPRSCWPAGTVEFDELAVRTPFRLEGGEGTIAFALPLISVWTTIEFVLFFPNTGTWFKNRRYDFSFALPLPGTVIESRPDPAQALAGWLPGEGLRKVWPLDSGHNLATCRIAGADGGLTVGLACDAPGELLLHWGVCGEFDCGWSLPAPETRPEATAAYDDRSVRTPFTRRENLNWLRLDFAPGAAAPATLCCVLYQPGENLWLKFGNNDVTLPLFRKEFALPFDDETGGALTELASAVVGAERGRSSWSLMHRYNLASELLGNCGGHAAELALIFVWLRFSAIRQLDWQRHYNTKPRDLAGAQQSLVGRLGELWRKAPAGSAARRWLRRILQTIGRGGDGGQGQQIRDEILNIMHRQKIPETKGYFLEEWHQKLHNNTTPDDVVICEAYLDYLHSNGRLDNFYLALERGGINRARLANYERAIVTDPIFYGDKRDGLISDFENYLRILKTVHGGGGLGEAYDRAAGRMDGGLRERVRALLGQSGGAGLGGRMRELARVREDLCATCAYCGDTGALLDLLYLDIALEERQRRDFEGLGGEGADWAELMVEALTCALLGGMDGELELCRKQWLRLLGLRGGAGREWALEALACLERVGRVVQRETTAFSALLQPLADFLGGHFRCAEWTVKLFAEEVVRGGESFPLAKLLHRLIPQMRAQAGIGGWQVISPAEVAAAVVEEIDDLHAVQEKVYEKPTLLLCREAGGDEEVPPGAAGLITRVAPDLVSHLSVRARNLGALFAACFEEDEYNKLRELIGRRVAIRTTPAGGVEYTLLPEVAAGAEAQAAPAAAKTFDASGVHARAFSAWAVAAEDFTRDILGGKSNNLNQLRATVADWIKLPGSLALPFGACEAALNDGANAAARTELERLLPLAEEHPSAHLPKMRETILALAEPAGLRAEVERVWRRTTGLPLLEEIGWDAAWRAIRRVWASKWNDRAFLSRRRLGLPHASLQMAVLVQQVVRADYAFVLHTVNPLTGNADEIYGELVLGLGETLVGNYPGRSLSFLCRKSDAAVTVLSLPGKSAALYGGGAIFRSDSNGEDLEGFAGAGLYDSYLAAEPRTAALDYTEEKLLRDAGYREYLLRRIAKIGMEVERVCGRGQDIEGAVEGEDFYVVQNRPQVGL